MITLIKWARQACQRTTRQRALIGEQLPLTTARYGRFATKHLITELTRLDRTGTVDNQCGFDKYN
jgi:hypothetical protein